MAVNGRTTRSGAAVDGASQLPTHWLSARGGELQHGLEGGSVTTGGVSGALTSTQSIVGGNGKAALKRLAAPLQG